MAAPRWLVLLLALGLGCGGGAHDANSASAAASSSSASTGRGEAALANAVAERDRAEDAAISAWYDPQLLTGDVRPDVLRGLEATAGPLDQLPLYDFDLDIAPDAKSFRLDERVYFQNRSNAALRDLMFRVYANTPHDGDAPEKLVRGHCVQTACTVEAAGRDAIVVHPAKPILPGARLRVVLHLEGTLKTIDASRTTMMAAATSSLKTMMGGENGESASTDYGLLGAGDDILSFGNFYP
ncbi:MAG TPA: hypothetical protein VLM85_13135, partial [Polyangiaceae bacterium]|nr:hypothetical protein [Polyangiaceae bacterium]